MDYLAILKGADQSRESGDSQAVTRPQTTEAEASKPMEPSATGGSVLCDSPYCAGCYELWVGGPRIHPPKASPEWQRWRERWEKVKQ